MGRCEHFAWGIPHVPGLSFRARMRLKYKIKCHRRAVGVHVYRAADLRKLRASARYCQKHLEDAEMMEGLSRMIERGEI